MIFISFIAFCFSKPIVSQFAEKSFVSWMRTNNKFFIGEEYHLRLGIWLSNMEYVRYHNKQGKTFKLSMNSLSHLTPAEYKSLLSNKVSQSRSKNLKGIPPIQKMNDAESLDLRKEGCVTPIRDCGSCGADWAFAATTQFESQIFRTTSTLYEFSESFLIDCLPESVADGCNSGDYTLAVSYVLHNYHGGMLTRQDYPYHASKQSCDIDTSKIKGNLSNHISVNEDQTDDILLTYFVGYYATVASCSLDADHASFQLYKSGIYDEPSCVRTNLNHAVSCVGYGVERNIQYFIIRNCWGASWGEDGYIRMVRGTNQCGLSNKVDIFN